MQIEDIKLTDLRPYENNPRNNAKAVEAVANSIREFGFKVPIVIDKDNVIICGHTRAKASEKLGLKTVPCIRADDLTDEQINAYRLADNKTAELAEWDAEKLDIELQKLKNFDMMQFGFEELGKKLDDLKYTTKTEVPHYEVKGIKYELTDLVNVDKAKMLYEEIDNSEISKEEKDFLKLATCRLYEFDYSKIAEYYASAEPETQRLFEMLALVIVDLDNAIANGYVKMSKELEKLRKKDDA